LNKCLDSIAAERSRQHLKYNEFAQAKKTYVMKAKQEKELKRLQTLCQGFGQKSPTAYLESFALNMELPNPGEDRKPEPATPTVPLISDENDAI
jgi:hypothetical protein